MEPESMVHALEQIRGLLAPDGRLIDIHPIGEPPPIYVRLDGERHLAGWIQEASDYVRYGQADDALGEAVQRGWFQVEQRQQVNFATYAGNLTELEAHLNQSWKDAWIEDMVAMRIEALFSTLAKEKELIVEEKIWMAKYRKRQQIQGAYSSNPS